MISLKAFGPALAEAFSTTPSAIYERQRALVRLGLLPAPIGRGRGNGLPASAEAVAMIIIAMMVTDNLSEMDDRVRRMAAAEHRRLQKRGIPKPRCALTGERDFKSALMALLRMTEIPTHLTVEVSRNYLQSVIRWVDEGVSCESRFVGGSVGKVSYFTVQAFLGNGALEWIGRSLRHANDQQLDPHDAIEEML
ncbi:hypothetical protein [Bradyrhizobium japonicum]|uniref:hypothetical protein n=1 Tax=Bradyrhizobium japonicum TaxID=375 RepID=UPI001BA8C209|nr:hypothetical protein [Bradyrhizobium japonicum]MBR0760751.1 hypothetical protein [Bradyrhizobium japonicum]